MIRGNLFFIGCTGYAGQGDQIPLLQPAVFGVEWESTPTAQLLIVHCKLSIIHYITS
jgi:hypothetical protein